MKERSMFRLLSRIQLQLLLAFVLAVPPIAMSGTASADPADSAATFAGELLASCEYNNVMGIANTTVSCPDTISIGSSEGHSFAGVLKFDLNGFSGTVLEANLELFVTDNHANDEGSPELTIHRYSGSWIEPPSASEAPADWPWVDVLKSRTFPITAENGQWVKFNIAPLVRDSIAKGEDELDLVLLGSWAEAPGKRFFQFTSSKLNIAYTTTPVQLPIPQTRIAAGDGFTLSLQDDGTVKAYGGTYEQHQYPPPYHKLEVPDSLTGVQAVYASNDCGYAIKADGSVVAMGYGCAVPDEVPNTGVIGLVLDGSTSAALMNDGTIINWGSYAFTEEWRTIHGPFKSVSGGNNHAAALTWDNAVVSWGSASTGATAVPEDLPETAAIASGLNHTLALLTDGTVRWWGPYYLEPVPDDLSDVVAVDANDNYSVALKRDGQLVVWGDGGQLQPPPGLDGVVAIAAGSSHLIALKSDGTLVGWGNNRHGETVTPAPFIDGLSWVPGSEIGTTTATIADGRLQDERYGELTLKYRIGHAGSDRQPYVGEDPADYGYDTELQPGVDLVVSPGQHMYVVAEYDDEGDKKVAYWSDVAITRNQVKQSPVQLPVPQTRIAAGDGFTLSLQDDGTVKGYGWINGHKIEVPDGLTGVQAVYASNECGYAMKADGSVTALGEGCTVPAEVPGSGVVGLVLDGSASAALMNDGTIISWGSYLFPEEWRAIHAPFKSVSGGYNHASALTWDDAVVSWGSASMGATSVPEDLPATTAIASGLIHTVALLTDGTVRSWGPHYLEPVPDNLSDVEAVDANDNYSVALKRDGHVVVWGDGGQLQPPPGLDGVVAIAAGRSHLIALKSDGTLVGWGNNRHGETVTPAPSIDGLSWVPGSEIGTTKATVADGRLQDERYGELILKYRIGDSGGDRQPYVGEDPADFGYDTVLQPGENLLVTPGQHMYVVAEYDDEGNKRIAYWSDVVITSSHVKQASGNNNNNNKHNNNNNNPPPPNDGKEIISVDVIIGEEQSADIAKVEIERTRQANGQLFDLVTFDEAKANEVAKRAATAKQHVARIVIPDAKDEVGEVRVNVPRSALAVLQKDKIDLEIHTDNAVIRIPIASLDGLDEDFYFRLVPIREAALRQEIEQRARTEEVVREIAGNDDIQVVARPMIIETNLSSRAITLTLPLRDVVLPQDPQERAAYLKHMGIFIEHSDGDKAVVTGKAVTGADGKPGLQFEVSKFSTFTILHMAATDDVEQQSGIHVKYINGYPDGTFQAERHITRAEMATLLVNSGIVPASSDAIGASFPDVAAAHWAAANIGRAEKSGLLAGYPDGSYRADASITRAEMAAIAYRYLKPASAPSRTFSDVPASHWASDMIAALSGYMEGGPDRTFRPNDKLTRAEAVTILNRILQRGPLNGIVKPSWPDVDSSHWAFASIEEASTDHAYALRPEGGEWVAE